jgi:hypothetical protein
MSGSDPSVRYALEAAAKQAGFELQPSDYDSYAMIAHTKHHTLDGLLSGEPFVFGRFPVDGVLGFYALAFVEHDGHEIAQVKDKDGKVHSEHKAHIHVTRGAPSSPQVVIGRRHCWLEARVNYGCLQVHGACGGYSFAYSSCG